MVAESAGAAGSNAVYKVVTLVSNAPGQALTADSRVVNPWGLASAAAGGWWIADEGNGRITYYNGGGVPLPALSPRVVDVPVNPGGIYDNATPMGIVVNDTDDFALAPGIPARLLIATRDGTIIGWGGDAEEYNAALLADNSPEAVYTGAVIALESGNLLYVANFGQGRIEAYGTDFSAVPLGAGAFSDPFIPEGFSPFNIQNINGMLYVTYAGYLRGERNAAAGEGEGYVDVFDPEGNLVLRLQEGPWMNAPWGVALSPEGFGDFSRRLLVGNSGSGRIASFDPFTGKFLGYLPGRGGDALAIPGLHGLGFGNDGIAGPADTLFFTAGFRSGEKSVFGSISVSAGTGIEGGGSVTTGPGMGY